MTACGLRRLVGMGSGCCFTGWAPPSKGGSRSVAAKASLRLADSVRTAPRGRNGRARPGAAAASRSLREAAAPPKFTPATHPTRNEQT